MRALFLAGYVPEAAAVMRGWLATGNEIAAVWNPQMLRAGSSHRDERLAVLAPRWSVASAAKRAGVKASIVPQLSTWPGRLEAAAATGADVLISVYFNFRVPEDMLDTFKGRSVNFHPAPLPRFRGPVPTLAMIADRSIERDATMTLHAMSPGLDEGDIIAQAPIAFPSDSSMIRYRLAGARAAEGLARQQLPDFLNGILVPTKQDPAAATYLRAGDVDVNLRGDMSSETVRWHCDTFAKINPILIDGLAGIPITGFGRTLGPPTGKLPAVRAWHVDFDCRDARVRVNRKGPWTSPCRKLSALAIYMTEPS